MTANNETSLAEVFFTHFVPCIFVGVILLYAINGILPNHSLSLLVDDMFTMTDFVMGGIIGLCVAGSTAAYHLYRNSRLHRVHATSRMPATKGRIIMGAAVGFVAGASDILLLLHSEGVILLTGVVLVILFLHLRVFGRELVRMLHPSTVATWGDVAEMARIYLTMLAGFTLVNATLEATHLLARQPAPFGFFEDGDLFLNSLYYTVVTMTTLGYGDIVPQTWDAKLLLIVECLVSYVMFALVVGIITRGVIRGSEAESE